MGFSDMTDRMVWPPSLSRDRKLSRVTKCTHSRVVGLRLRGNRVLLAYSLAALFLCAYCHRELLFFRLSSAALLSSRLCNEPRRNAANHVCLTRLTSDILTRPPDAQTVMLQTRPGALALAFVSSHRGIRDRNISRTSDGHTRAGKSLGF